MRFGQPVEETVWFTAKGAASEGYWRTLQRANPSGIRPGADGLLKSGLGSGRTKRCAVRRVLSYTG